MATTRLTARRLVTVSAIGTLVALALMVIAIVVPNPFPLVLAMSVGQLLGTASLSLYLLAIVLDLQASAAERAGEADAPRGGRGDAG